MKIEIVMAPERPLDVGMATARTCYSTSPVKPSDLDGSLSKDFCQDLWKSGHLTVFMHVNYTFLLQGVSRHLVWNSLHSVEFYNTEQMSQRYTLSHLIPETAYIPDPKTDSIEYKNRVASLYSYVGEKYKELVAVLLRGGKNKKQAQEDARYILPVSVFTNMYYTVNLVTLIRMYRKCLLYSQTKEEREFAVQLKDVVLARNPELDFMFDVDSRVEENNSIPFYEEEFQKDFGLFFAEREENNVSFLLELSCPTSNWKREDVSDALKRAGQSSFNLIEPLGIDYGVFPGSNALKKICLRYIDYRSLASDCQEQRHRTIRQIRPALKNAYFGIQTVDYYVPSSIKENKKALSLYDDCLEHIYKEIDVLRGQTDEWFVLLPNATKISVMETGDIGAFQNKWFQRLCFNAQEETRLLNVQQYLEFKKECEQRGFDFYKYMGPPCSLRKLQGGSRLCYEGKRCCCSRGVVSPWDSWCRD